MPTANNLMTVTAILALAALPSTVVAVPQKRTLVKNRLRRGQINHADNVKKQEAGLEEDVVFWTNMVRKTQEMSVPIAPPVPTPTLPPVVVDPVPSEPPVTVAPPIVGPPVVITPPPQPVVGIICAQGETCLAEGDTCTDGTTEECCDEVFDSFVCTCESMGDQLMFQCEQTNACADRVCETQAPVDGGSGPTPPIPTPSPIPATGGFQCPDPDFVGCTAVDPADFEDECPTVGEPCPDANAGEFCCLDGCPRNYCTAKQAPMSVDHSWMIVPIQFDEVNAALEGLNAP